MGYNTAYFYLTPEGERLVAKLSASHPGDIYGKENFKTNLQEAFGRYEFLVCVMATGIVVRILAPLIVHKTSDPGVVVLDQRGRHAISLLSGHLGGANDLAREMAAICGGDPVITTATDVAGELSFDTFAKKHGMAIENIGTLKHISGALLEGRSVCVVSDREYKDLGESIAAGKMKMYGMNTFAKLMETMAADTKSVETMAADTKSMETMAADSHMEKNSEVDGCEAGMDESIKGMPLVVIDEGYVVPEEYKSIIGPALYLRPRTICAGIGCKRNMDQEPIEEALRTVLKEEGLSPLSLKCISTIPLKSNEPGIIVTAEHLNVPLTIIPTEEIEKLDINDLGIAPSEFVAKQTGVLSVSTASSYLASGKGQILRDKVKFKGITIALSKVL